MAHIGLFFYSLAGGLVVSLFKAYAVACLWQWYITTIFDVGPIGMAQAFGLALVSGILTYQLKNPEVNDDDVDVSKQAISTTLGVLVRLIFVALCLGYGWLAIQLWPINA